MSVRQFVLSALNRLFRLRGMELRALLPLECDAGMDAALLRASRLAPEVATVIDVGAAQGKWTRRSLRYFPRARHLLVEPLAERVGELTALCAEFPAVDFVTAAAGEAVGEVSFHGAPDLDGSGVRPDMPHGARRVPVTTLDREVSSRALAGPYFLKLDTHGFELPILRGGERVLAGCALLMIEAYNFQLIAGCLRFHELCAWLEPRGFRVCDLAEPLRRPGDTVLWQMDLVFARSDHPAFTHTKYQ